MELAPELIMHSVNNPAKVGVAVLCLFALIFGVAGFAVLGAATRLSAGQRAPLFLMGSAGLSFTLVGFGLGVAAFHAARKLKTQRTLQAQNAGSPWMWREDWAQGRCNSCRNSTLVQAWTLAVLWNVVSAPMVFMVFRNVERQRLALLGLLFPLAGAALLLRAIRETLAWLEFGVTWFEITKSPVVIGREFHGSIHARFPHGADHGIQLKVSCVNRMVTGSGKGQSVTEKILWRDEKSVSPAELYPGPLGTLIPVNFRIPWNAMQSDSNNPRNSIFWVLEADADVPGVDYKDVFELPVFRTQDTPTVPEAGEQGRDHVAAAPTQPTVRVTPTSNGLEFYFPPARNHSFAMGLTTFSMLWTGALALIVFFHAPIIFPVVFGFFDLLLLTGAIQLWFGTSRVIVEPDRVKLQSGLLGGGKWREFPKSQILDFQTTITAQQGGATGIPYYDIRLLQTEHHNVTLGRTIKDKEEAEWIASEMRKALRLRMALAAATSS